MASQSEMWLQTSSLIVNFSTTFLNSTLSEDQRQRWGHLTPLRLIETLYRENVSFRDRDLKRQIPCHTASKNLDAQLLRNDTSFLSNLLCKSPLINYSLRPFSFVFFSRSIDMKREFWRFRQKSEHRFPPCLHAELPTTCYNHSIVTLAHNRGRPCFSDVRIGNVFYSWPEMAKCFFYRIYHPHLAKSYIW